MHRTSIMFLTRGDRASERWWVSGLAIAIALLTLATGLCLFDQEDHDTAGHLVPDLCLGMLAVSFGMIPVARLWATGWAVLPPAVEARVVARNTPDPPPRPARVR